jgi:hypothetical protein
MPSLCDGKWSSLPPGSQCPSGSTSTPLPNSQQPVPVNSMGEGFQWNQDTSPVQVGSERKYLGSTLETVPTVMAVAKAQDIFNQVWGAGSVKGASAAAKQQKENMLALLRRYSNSELGTRGAAEQAWNDALTDAARGNVDVYQLLAGESGFDEDDKSGSGRGGYSGPTATTTFMDERDVDRTANALALELIGRPLSQKEIAKVTKRLRSEEAANPTISTPGVGSSVTQSGLSAEGRADVLREVIAENPEYQQFQVDNTVLDTMLSELNKREQMVNGG